MLPDNENFYNKASIFKYVFENEPVHKNILRKNLLAKGKISSKDKFYKAVNELVETGKLIISKENFYLNTDLVNVGLLQTAGKNFYITPYKSNEKIFIDRSIASGYHNNDVLDILIEENDNQKDIVILGKSIKPFVAKENAHDNKKQKLDIIVMKKICLEELLKQVMII